LSAPGFHIFVLKLVGFCNLNCSYCYMFNSADRSHAEKPQYMDPEIARRTLERIRNHMDRSAGSSAAVALHGGEPTLWPLQSFRLFFREVGRMRAEGVALDLTMQTNLWRLPTWELFELCREHRVSIGVSLDGPRHANDVHRTDFSGRGSYDKIIANVRRAIDRGFGDLFSGFLSVMQPCIEPKAYLEWLASLPVTRVDVLWPIEFNLAHRPWGSAGKRNYAAHPLYGEWVERLFEEWWRLDRPELEIRLFADSVEAMLGGGRRTDVLGADSFASLVVNTDGAIELADYFRTAAHNGSRTGYSVFEHDFDAVACDSRVARLHRTARSAPAPCLACRHVQVCRGGTLSGRLDSAGEVTRRNSVLCHDHKRFFDAVARSVEAERLSPRVICPRPTFSEPN
jgi:uncharacterized protein